MEKKPKPGALSPQGVATTVILIMFFIGVIITYYAMLYAETRRSVIRSGELSARGSAEQIEDYLSTGIDVIRMSSYALDNMIRDGRSQAEILDYLLNQSAAVENITEENSPGLYGYINGEYLDGTGWTPDEGYDPTVRPWYIGPRVSIGRVAVVDPYIDLDSQTVMIALGKTLCDAASVVSMDLSLAPVQAIVEGNSELEIVLDRKYRVIAHSEASEVGKSYAAESGTLGGALVRSLRAAEEDYFSLRFDGRDYIVYATPVAKNWVCLSVCNATDAFSQLEKTLIFTIVASVLVVSVLVLVMYQAGRRARLAQQLRVDLSQAESDIREKEGQIGQISKVAFRDALTGVGSKAAFQQLSEELSPQIAAGRAALAVVMIDVNDLKYVNDAFGHDKGDAYLRGCCKIICDVYDRSPVFRLGGDEFAAVLQNADYEERAALAKKLRAAFETAYARETVEPWERYSAAAGMAEPEPGDGTLEQVLKRADAAMYEEKQTFKKAHGSYR